MKPTAKAIAEARKCPDGHVFVIKGHYGPNAAIPPHAIKGAWKVDANGKIYGDFIPNPIRKRVLFRQGFLHLWALKAIIASMVILYWAIRESSAWLYVLSLGCGLAGFLRQ